MGLPGGRNAALVALLAGSTWVLGCDALVDPPICAGPEVAGSSVTSNPNNVLSAIVRADVRTADSVAVRFGMMPGTFDSMTPAIEVRGDSVLVPLLGLYESRDYHIQLLAFNTCGATTGTNLTFATGTLPADLPAYTAAGTDPSPGYVAFAAGGYGVVIDNTGRVVWYHRFTGGPVLNFQPQPNGRYAGRPTPSNPGVITPWVEIDALGTATRTLGCARDLQPRFHDLLVEPDGSYWILCDQVRTVDLSAIGASARALVLGTGVQHVSVAGDLLFDWTPFDHFEVDRGALEGADQSAGAIINWTHGNALDLDTDGNLIVSFRNLSEVSKIDTRTGKVLWRMGGARNQFTFENVAGPAFARQHGVRSTGSGRLLLLDNLGNPTASRAERYEYDEARRTVRLSSSYASSPDVVAQIGGTTQDLPGGRTLVSFGNGGSVQEYSADGTIVWRIEGNPGYVFRAQRIRSLYQPGKGDPR